jgi:tRNA A-37 threonylcarbamoyl transferase component Bud32
MNLAGQLISNYEIIEQIGHGGMATVYRACDLDTGNMVAVKVLLPYVAENPDNVGRFEREIKVLRGLSHPNIMPILDYGRFEDQWYIVMPFMDAGTLRDRLGNGPLTPHEGAQVMNQVAAALEHAHQSGIVHRDVKPSNIMLDEDGHALLTDFGLARVRDATLSLTGSAVIGTPSYMSPEQGRGEEIDARADQYSLGVVLYQLATGQLPYQAETPVAAIVKHITDPLPQPREISPNLPPSVEAVIVKALAKDPDERFASVSQFNQAFQQALAAALDPSQPQPASNYLSASTIRLDDAPPYPDDDQPVPLVPLPTGGIRPLWLGAALLPLVVIALTFAARARLQTLAASPDEGVGPVDEATATPTFLAMTLNAQATETALALAADAVHLETIAAQTLAAMPTASDGGGGEQVVTPLPPKPGQLQPTPTPLPLVQEPTNTPVPAAPDQPADAPVPVASDDSPPDDKPPDDDPKPTEKPKPTETKVPEPTPTDDNSPSNPTCSDIALEWIGDHRLKIHNEYGHDIVLTEIEVETVFNAVLGKIRMGLFTIWEGAGGGAWDHIILDGPVSQRTIDDGESEKLYFIYVSGDAPDYPDVELTFDVGCTISP